MAGRMAVGFRRNAAASADQVHDAKAVSIKFPGAAAGLQTDRESSVRQVPVEIQAGTCNSSLEGVVRVQPTSARSSSDDFTWFTGS